ncbi:MAG: glycosyltransferase [Anaerolineae bacterium]|nr:glycosyltransferase [Anaerolineae bacterium]
MKILFVVPYVPNLIRVRPYNFIRYLAKFGNQVTVATLWSNEGDLEDIERLRGEGVRVEAEQLPTWRPVANSLKTLPGKQPLQAHYSWQPNLAKKLSELCANGNGRFPFDAVHIEHIRGARYGLYLKKLLAEKYNGQPIPLVWDSVDCISLLFRKASSHSKSLKGRLMTQLDLKRTEAYEAWLVKQFDQILLTSPFDRDAYLALLSPPEIEDYQSKIQVLPNGVDLDYFRPDTSVQRYPATLVVSGKMSYHANITMVVNLVGEIMPLVWEKRPDIKLQIVGKDPARNIQAMAEHPQIEVLGTVPDLRPFLQQATVAVAPIVYGVGIQNKVLEAMACATPVVATTQAVSAITAVPGQDILVGSEPSQISDAILQLVNDPALCREIGENGYRFVTKEHNWTAITKHLETYYQMQKLQM